MAAPSKDPEGGAPDLGDDERRHPAVLRKSELNPGGEVLLSRSRTPSTPTKSSHSPPNGEAIALPQRFHPVDFAYAIHSEVWRSTVGAKVNGRLSPLHRSRSTGATVEIMTTKNEDADQRGLAEVRSLLTRPHEDSPVLREGTPPEALLAVTRCSLRACVIASCRCRR